MGVIGALLVVGWATALQAPGVEIGPDHTQQAYAGDTILYHHTLTNTGATTDTFTLEVLSTQGWPVELVGATQPTGTLSLQAAAQMTVPFQVSLTVPAGAVGLTDTTIITATSQLSPTVTDSATDTTTAVYHRIILPFVAKRWPPVPYAPTLNPIDNSDEDVYYTVSWLPAELAEVYILEEDDNASFSSPIMVYYGTGTSWSATDPVRRGGTYYYRARGQNLWGYGAYSNIQSVTVPPFLVANTELNIGECTTLSWNFTGIKELHVVLGYGYDAQAVSGQGSQQVCPSVTTTYEAIVTRLDDSEVTYERTVNVNGMGCSGDPVVWYFKPSDYTISSGGAVDVCWIVECAKAIWFQIGSGSEHGVTGHGCENNIVLYSTKTFKLKIKKANGDYVYASFKVKVK
jgi:hypothetical protein